MMSVKMKQTVLIMKMTFKKDSTEKGDNCLQMKKERYAPFKRGDNDDML